MACSRLINVREDDRSRDAGASDGRGGNALEQLAAALGDEELARALAANSLGGLEPYWHWLQERPGESHHAVSKDFQEFVRVTREHWSLRGTYISELGRLVEFVLRDNHSQRWSEIELGLLETRDYNACAASTSDGTAIFLYLGFVQHQRNFWKAFLGFMSANQLPPEPAPMCAHLSIFDFVVTMVNEVASIMHPELQLAALSTYWCEECGPTRWDDYAEEYIRATELFVVLHEVGHVVLGHLEKTGARPLAESQDDELAADEWAVSVLSATDDPEWQRRSAEEAALAAGVFFAIVELMELAFGGPASASTHPAAAVRRLRVNSQCGIIDGDSSVAAELDSVIRGTAPIQRAFEALLTSIGVRSPERDVLRDLVLDVEAKTARVGSRDTATIDARREFWAALALPVWPEVEAGFGPAPGS